MLAAPTGTFTWYVTPSCTQANVAPAGAPGGIGSDCVTLVMGVCHFVLILSETIDLARQNASLQVRSVAHEGLLAAHALLVAATQEQEDIPGQ